MTAAGRARRRSRPASTALATRLARASAVVSLARGLVGLIAPVSFARLAGVRPDATRTRLLFGLREVVVGVGLAVTPRPRRWVAARLAGDVIDLGLHTFEIIGTGARSRRTSISLAVVVTSCLVDRWLLARS